MILIGRVRAHYGPLCWFAIVMTKLFCRNSLDPMSGPASFLFMQELPLWDESSLLLLISATRRRMRQVAWHWLAPHNVTPQQYTVLMVLSERPGISLREVAELVWVDNPTTSRILKNLQDRGLVEAVTDPSHGRRLKLTLSEKGAALALSLRQLRRNMIDGIETGLSEDEGRQIRKTLRHLMSNLARMEEGFVPGQFPSTAPRRGH